jgi:hypothetical protein
LQIAVSDSSWEESDVEQADEEQEEDEFHEERPIEDPEENGSEDQQQAG